MTLLICLYPWFPVQQTASWHCHGLEGEWQAAASCHNPVMLSNGIILPKAWTINGSDSLWETPWGLGVIRLKNGPWVANLLKTGIQFTITSLAARTFGRHVLLRLHWASKQNCPPIGQWSGILKNQASYPFKCSPLAWECGRQDCSNSGQARSFQTLVFPPDAARHRSPCYPERQGRLVSQNHGNRVYMLQFTYL